jgi:hypothetical protein
MTAVADKLQNRPYSAPRVVPRCYRAHPQHDAKQLRAKLIRQAGVARHNEN